ncbi:hypothetical protein QR680_003731 [Steinernema hermaphroditum]|uniref:Uncharacterized protein n=1 Tax=Steinernema hermaphroditum TaxID=289476 RepID=A0AA39HNK8_9BILA|nr:hypothetical protein QR680_003731 [Steinernema hermaphroditum]
MVTQVIHPSVPFGLAFVSLSCFGFFTNTLLFMTLINNKDFSPTTSRIIKSLCISCMLQLFGLAIGGIMTLAQSSFNDTFDVMRIKSTHRLSSMTKELRILIAAVVSFAVQTVYVGGGYWQLFGGNSHPYVSLTMIIECGMFASVTMIISGTLREKAIEMILGKKAKVVVVTTHSSSSVQSSHK